MYEVNHEHILQPNSPGCFSIDAIKLNLVHKYNNSLNEGFVKGNLQILSITHLHSSFRLHSTSSAGNIPAWDKSSSGGIWHKRTFSVPVTHMLHGV